MLVSVKKVILSSLLSLLVFGLVACSGESETGSDGGSKSEDGKVKLTLWETWTDDTPDTRLLKERVEEFNSSQEEIVIELRGTAHNEYRTKLKTQAAGGELPELFLVWPGAELEPLVEGGVVEPINDVREKYEGELIQATTLDDYAIDGKQYAIPASVSYTSIIYYNKELLAQAGYDKIPDTYKGFKEMIEALKAEGITPILAGNKPKWPLQSVYISTIADRFTGSDYLDKVLNGDEKFTNPKFIESLAVISELKEMGAFNEDINTIDEVEARDDLLKGEGALFLSGSWSTTAILGALPEGMEIGAASFPSVEGGEGNPEVISGISSIGIAINSKLSDDEKAAAKKFLEYFYDEKLYSGLLANGTLVPADVPLPEDASPLFTDVYNITKGGVAPVYDGVLPAELTTIINNGLQGIVTGSITPKELAQQMQDELDNQ
ncbi:extracellular solute-binding protein [Aquibacillus kalidii]|uniref:extracellular solute-binding protein n=1 Tax=Aquibacillus kalidii TaxID=2762597 RepID=UPI0016449FB6|nr:extracellular solute-binding protein [Aquibacillus kalidii]